MLTHSNVIGRILFTLNLLHLVFYVFSVRSHDVILSSQFTAEPAVIFVLPRWQSIAVRQLTSQYSRPRASQITFCYLAHHKLQPTASPRSWCRASFSTYRKPIWSPSESTLTTLCTSLGAAHPASSSPSSAPPSTRTLNFTSLTRIFNGTWTSRRKNAPSQNGVQRKTRWRNRMREMEFPSCILRGRRLRCSGRWRFGLYLHRVIRFGTTSRPCPHITVPDFLILFSMIL